MDFEKLKQKYENKLEALAAFPVWTVEQIKEILNLDFNTIPTIRNRWLAL